MFPSNEGIVLLQGNNIVHQTLRAQWPFATYLYIAGLWAYLQKIYKVKIYKAKYW